MRPASPAVAIAPSPNLRSAILRVGKSEFLINSHLELGFRVTEVWHALIGLARGGRLCRHDGLSYGVTHVNCCAQLLYVFKPIGDKSLDYGTLSI